MKSAHPYAVVTGCSSGIGYGYCVELLRQGYNVIGVSLNQTQFDALKPQFPHQQLVSITSDLSVAKNVQQVYEQAKGYDVELVVNCAGFGDYCLLFKANPDEHARMIDVNVRAVFMLTRLFLADMVAQKRGRIINISSVAGFMPLPYDQTYAGTKAFVRNLSIAVNHELKVLQSPVRVVAVCPGVITTEFYNRIAKTTAEPRMVAAMEKINRLRSNVPRDKFCRLSLRRALNTKNRDTVVVGGYNWLLLAVSKLLPHRFTSFCLARALRKYFR